MGIPIFLSNSEFSVNIPFLEHVYSIYFGRSYVYSIFLSMRITVASIIELYMQGH